MTEWKSSTVRHIPEDELHAYLDQALSRSQCVEIERHLARCPRCQTGRDQIASLRDRTTDLLARIGPPPIITPAFQVLHARSAARRDRRVRRWAAGAWVASLLFAGFLGWRADRLRHPRVNATPEITIATAPPVATPLPLQVGAPTAPWLHQRPTPAAETRRLVQVQRPRRTGETTVRFASATEVAPTSYDDLEESMPPGVALEGDLSSQPVGADPGLRGLWRTIAPDSGVRPAAVDIPLVPGLPVIQMRIQPGQGVGDVTAVDQVLETGDLIRTLAGPVSRVEPLLDHDPAAGPLDPPERAAARTTVTIQQGDRMVAVTGPSQALGSLLSRVTAKRRRY